MPAIPTRPARCRRSMSRFSNWPSPRRRPTTTVSSIATSPVVRWRRAATMPPDADAGKASGNRSDPFAPLTSQLLPVGDSHEIYVETVGRTDGIPAVYLHGGPGSGCWGATLALAYAQAHPDRVGGIVLRATFLGTRSELEGAFLDALPRFYPDLSEDFLQLLPPEERAQPLDAYWRRILDSDPAVHGPAARAWHDTERILSEHTSGRVRLDPDALNSTRALPSTPFMEAHYFQNNCFMRPNRLLAEAGKLEGILGVIVQGRYDLLCPPATSHALGALWPGSEVRFVEGAGHSLYDPGIRDAVMKAISDLASRIRG